MDPDTDPDPYRDTDKTCLGRGMHCPVLLVYTIGLLFTASDLI